MAQEIDDGSLALAMELQIEELQAQRDLRTGKLTENPTPDDVLAYDNFETELKNAFTLSKDLKLAYSIAEAVDLDAMAIEESKTEETQSIEDRAFALSLNEGENVPSQEVPDSQDRSRLLAGSIDWDHVLRATEASTHSVESMSTVAGPSAPYALRQKAVLDHLPQLKVVCVVCTELFHPHSFVRLDCDHAYCKPCMKDFFMRVAKDESLFPPKCCRLPLDLSIIEEDLSVEELAAYRSAELEFSSTDRLYCANINCVRFIPESDRLDESVVCNTCGFLTCLKGCRKADHNGECPPDEAKQSLIDLGVKEGWQSCFGCGEMVEKSDGCNHLICRCNSEFCYRCGMKWKGCSCGDWEPELRNQRAQDIVDREALVPLAPHIRQQFVELMEQELDDNHECDHSGKFTKVEVGRRGRACEFCATRHYKYLLSCRRCHMLACEDCRRHRL